MKVERIIQGMIKRAAAPVSRPVDQTRVYTDVNQLQGSKPAAFNYASGGIGSVLDAKSWEGFNANRNTRSIGTGRFSASQDIKGGVPVTRFELEGPDTDDFWDESQLRRINIYPTRLPSYYAGLRLLEASRRATQEAGPGNDNAERPVPINQTMNNEQISEIATNDPTYLDKRLAHLRKIQEKDWSRANLMLSAPNEIAAWRKYVPKTSPLGDRIFYGTSTGTIFIPPDVARKRYDAVWKDISDGATFIGVPRAAKANKVTTSGTWPGAIFDSLNHERIHQSIMGRLKESEAPGQELKRYVSQLYDPNTVISNSNMPALMRQRKWQPFLLTDKQLDWIKNHAIETYAVSEPEMNQALMSFNEGRWALKQHMQADKNNPNYTQLKPEVRKQFMALPDFIEPGEKGRQQLDSMMQFFKNNPELRLLMPEQFRFVGYYQNLKAAVDTAKTPEEKAYFQNLMDHFIYSKAFLANNQQRTAPSYQDAYQQMYA